MAFGVSLFVSFGAFNQWCLFSKCQALSFRQSRKVFVEELMLC